MKRLLPLLLVLLAPFAFGKTRATRSVQNDWHPPQCALTALPWLRFLDADFKVHRSAVDPPMLFQQTPLTTDALAAGAAPNVLWALTSDGGIHVSADAGCNWDMLARTPEITSTVQGYQPGIVARHEDRTYVYTANRFRTGQSYIVRISGKTVEVLKFPDTSGVMGLDVDPADASHVRAIARNAIVYESNDGASTWHVQGYVSANVTNVVAVAFDRNDFDHILAGTVAGARASHDGGRTWTVVAGLPQVSIQGVEISPADSNVIWVGADALYRSLDGGQSFQVIDTTPQHLFSMDSVFAAHPRERSTFVTNGDFAFGLHLFSAEGARNVAFENVRLTVWAPNGTLYYLTSVITAR